MDGHPEIIEVLNEVLTAELTAINQYFAHSEICENWGYERLHQAIREHAIGEMKHAEELIARVLYLNAMPNMARYFEIKIGDECPRDDDNMTSPLKQKRSNGSMNLFNLPILTKISGRKSCLSKSSKMRRSILTG